MSRTCRGNSGPPGPSSLLSFRLLHGLGHLGVGLPAGGPERLFEPFYSTKKSGGTGLGLAISRDIVRRHGGEIRLAPREGGGVEAVVTLPLSAPVS